MIEFLQNNWVWILFALLFVGMHSLGGGCCGGVGRDRKKKSAAGDQAKEAEEKSCH